MDRSAGEQGRWAGLPFAVRYVLTLIAVLAGALGLNLLVARVEAGVLLVIGLAAVAGPTLALQGRRREARRLGGHDQLRRWNESVAQGRVVPGADRERWRAQAPRMARRLRESRRSAQVTALLGIVVTALAAAISLGRGDDPFLATSGLVLIGLPGAIVLLLASSEKLPGRRRMAAVLRELEAGDDVPPDRADRGM